jgi:hypothetical protein
MSTHDWLLPDRSPRCLFADSLYRTGQALLQQLAGSVTEEALAAAKEALAQHRAELAAKLSPMHFGVAVGRHVCVQDIYDETIAILRCLAVTRQPAPEVPPAPPPKPRTLADAAEDFFADTESDSADTDNGE